MLILGEIRNRCEFGTMLRERGLLHLAVEVGVHRGEFALDFLQEWPGETYVGVDPFLAGYDDADPVSRQSHGDRMNDRDRFWDAVNQVKHSSTQVTLLNVPSVAASIDPLFGDIGPIDFVYVDACHQPVDVLQDLSCWWKHIRSGGILAGHDFLSERNVNGPGGRVQQAVLPFAAAVRRPVNLVIENGTRHWSFYIER